MNHAMLNIMDWCVAATFEITRPPLNFIEVWMFGGREYKRGDFTFNDN
jgi:hypothetical protein